MKERPILMNAFSVRWILEDRKWMTRRRMKPQPVWERGAWTVPGFFANTERGFAEGVLQSNFRCPYGVPGDRLWVRETLMPVMDCENHTPETDRYGVIYKADPGGVGERPIHYDGRAADYFDGSDRWRPSIFMPRWASRLLLEVKDVRVERVREITGDDILAEGVNSFVHKDASYFERAQREEFSRLWDSINGKPRPVHVKDQDGKKVIDHYASYPWEEVQETRTHNGKPWHVIGNPWVWVIGFRRLDK